MKYQVKLIYVYNDIEADTEEEAIEIANQRGHSAPNDCYYEVEEE